MKTVLRTAFGAALASLLGLPAHALTVTDQVKINEVSYDPGEATEESFEFIELYNAGGTTVFLDGAALSDEGNNGTGEATFVFPGVVGGTTIPLASHAYLVIVGDATGSTIPADYEFFGGGTDTDAPGTPNLTKSAGTGADMQLANGGDGITLSTGLTTGSSIPCAEVVDGVSWENGGAGDVTALSNTVCSDATPNPGYVNTPGTILTMQRCPNGVDTNNSTNDFSSLNRTPKAANGCNSIPPSITNLRYSPCFVTAGQQVNVICSATDDNNDITSVRVYYKLEAAVNYDSLTMAFSVPDVYTATLPGQIDQSHVLYYVGARDATGNFVKSPSSAPGFARSYRVGLQTIASLQVPAINDSCAESSQITKATNVVGVVTHKAFEYSGNFFYMQNGIGPNSGIKVFTTTDSSFVPQLGDSIRVSGFIDEFRCQTEVVLFQDCGTIIAHNKKVRARQLANVSDINLELNESMLVTVQGPINVLTANDSTNFGKEFKIGSGANSAWVGDDTFFPDGIGYSIVPAPGMVLDAITGIVGSRIVATTPGPRPETNRLLRLEPRRDNDVDRDFTDAGNDQIDVVRAFRLGQNSPNPFNPTTTIEFVIPKAGHAALRIYDAQGRLVRNLLDRDYKGAMVDRTPWDGRDDAGKVVPSGVYFYRLEAGDYSASRKMLLLK